MSSYTNLSKIIKRVINIPQLGKSWIILVQLLINLPLKKIKDTFKTKHLIRC